jgi:glycosyltransferase involved in cell wall biosynthesis
MLALIEEQAKRQPTGVFALVESALTDRARSAGADVVILPRSEFAPFSDCLSESVLAPARALRDALGASVLHCHSAFGMRWMAPLATALDLRIVCHQRDMYVPDEYHGWIERADHIIAISLAVLQTLPPSLRTRASLIYNATSTVPPRTPGRELRVGAASRIVPEKGIHLFLDAVVSLAQDEQFAAQIWGLDSSRNQEDSDSVRRRVAALPALLCERIRLYPFRDDINVFYETTDIVVVPTLTPEPFGRVALEALAAGCLPIVAAHGGLIEIVEHEITGLVFPPGDAAGLREQLVRALNDRPLRERVSREGPTRVASRFSTKTHYRAAQSAYERS